MARSRKSRLPRDPVTTQIESLSHDGRGVAHIEGKATFVDGALPGETVTFIYTSRRRSFDEGAVETVLEASPDRVEPRCPHFGVCGGCSLQHMAPSAQITAKQQVLMENLSRIGNVQPERILEPLAGPHWGYRNKARIGIKYVQKKGGVLVGFRERRKPYVTQTSRCEVLNPVIGQRIEALAQLVEGLSIRDRVPQAEVAVGDDAAALVFRHLDPLSDDDLRLLTAFGERSGIHVYLQPGGPETVHCLWPVASELGYGLPDHGVRLVFLPTDFVQVNSEINRNMVNRALELLEVNGQHRVLDLFCGLGNFTLPLARHAAAVTGVEGDAGLVARARANAALNGLDNVTFHATDLFAEVADHDWVKQAYDRILLDPPRSGAAEILPQVAGMAAKRIVYVSCHPGSLARDAGFLVNEAGYRLLAAGVMDMFPHTAHVESIALFARA